MKHCPQCKKNRVSVGRELCDSCHRYQTHSEGIERQWEKVAGNDSEAGKAQPERTLSGGRIFFALILFGTSGLFLLTSLVTFSSDWEFEKMMWERCVGLASVKNLNCGSLQETREWFDRERLSEAAGPLLGIGAGFYLLLFPGKRGRS